MIKWLMPYLQKVLLLPTVLPQLSIFLYVRSSKVSECGSVEEIFHHMYSLKKYYRFLGKKANTVLKNNDIKDS